MSITAPWAPAVGPADGSATPITPLELIPTQTVLAGQDNLLDLSLFYVSEECAFAFQAAAPLEAAWSDEARAILSLTAPEGTMAIANLHITATRRGGEEVSEADVPVRVRNEQYHEFRFQPEGAVQSLFVAGDFNGWNGSRDAMTDEDGDGVYTARLAVEPGRHTYKFVLNGDWIADPGNPEQSTDGYNNSILVIEGTVSDRRPDLVRLRAEDGALTFAFAAGSASGEAPSRFLAFLDNALLGDSAVEEESTLTIESGGEVSTLTVALPAETDAEALRLVGIDGAGDFYPIEYVALANGRPVTASNRPEQTWRDTVLYYVVVDRFKNGDTANDAPVTDVPDLPERVNWQGGDLRGVVQAIEEGYFENLGVNTIWLSPLNRQPASAEVEYSPPNRTYTGYHGYWPTREDEIDPRFGTAEDLHAVVDAAHARGLRVILDYVAAHVHETHPLFLAHRDWFGHVELPDGRMNIKLFDEFRLTTWFDTFLPRFDFENSREALDHMTDNAVWWLTTFNLDGFRQDATKHIPHEFWRTLTRKMRLQVEIPEGRRTFQVGETISGRDLVLEYAKGGELDGQFDFPLYWPTRSVLGMGRDNMETLADAMQDSLDYYGPEPLISALIGNHDVSRFMAYADGDLGGDNSADDERTYGFEHDVQVDDPESYGRLATAFAFLLTQPEVPMIYYGDEVGITGALDPDNRRMMTFDNLAPEQTAVRDLVARLARIRHEHPAIWNGDFVNVQTTQDTWLYARVNFDEVLLVAVNRGDEGAQIEATLPATLGLAPSATLSDLLGDGTVEVGESSAVAFDIGPRAARVLHIAR